MKNFNIHIERSFSNRPTLEVKQGWDCFTANYIDIKGIKP